MPLVLVVTQAGLAGEYPVVGELTIGRAPENEIVLTAADVSRRHAQVQPLTSGCSVLDLGSANGTCINGQPVAPHVPTHLSAGDALSVGGVDIAVVERPARLRYPEPSSAGDEMKRIDPAPRLAPKLVVSTAGGQRSFDLSGDIISVGRGLANVINIEQAAVSAQHALLLRTPTGYRIEDRGSTNGLTVNGAKVGYHELADGDIVHIGDAVSLRYVSGPVAGATTKAAAGQGSAPGPGAEARPSGRFRLWPRRRRTRKAAA
jgi:pSer/pThr/pTyr-binding forkhead associated (FHA) protein